MTDVSRRAKRQYSLSVLDDTLTDIRAVAKTLGYAIAVHGSLAKDIDLLAAPWVEDAADHGDLAQAIADEFAKFFGAACINGDATEKPQGRMAYTIVLASAPIYIDLSVMPKR